MLAQKQIMERLKSAAHVIFFLSGRNIYIILPQTYIVSTPNHPPHTYKRGARLTHCTLKRTQGTQLHPHQNMLSLCSLISDTHQHAAE